MDHTERERHWDRAVTNPPLINGYDVKLVS